MKEYLNSRKFVLPLNLQHFAEPAPADPTPQPQDPKPKETQPQDPTPQQTFTQADMDRMISKMYEQFEQKFSKKQEEAAKLASMNAEEKARYEIEQSKKEIEDMRKNFTLQQNKTECMKILSEKNIDVALADFVVAEDATTMKANIDKIEKAFKKSVEAEVNNRLKGSTPKKDLNMPAEINKETFSKMTLSQQTELYNTNKDLFEQLTK